MFFVQIAEQKIYFEFFNENKLKSFFSKYLIERVDIVDLYIRFYEVSNIFILNSNYITFPGGRYIKEDGKREYLLNYKGTPRIKITINEQFSKIDVGLLKEGLTEQEKEDLVYIYGGYLLSDYLITKNAMMFHGSAISYQNQAIIFTAPCGTGKSTHTALWKKLLNKDVEYINDDKPIIMFNKQITVCGSMFSGKDHIDNNISAPLKAIIYMQRGEQNKIEKIEGRDAVFCLTEQFIKGCLCRVVDKEFEYIERILNEINVYKLTCNISESAIETVLKELVLNGDII